mmetsp:Transcript_112531/g.223667  ORF Transcript_112531/g.223667 Transcript_112531/m.223667 type:complete len:371 (+) Transcript_112531:83-1195(+)|eukprot:CAMPEP_0172901620 /NCGR_PEP_ID=MMETSP1075-20121228/166625_1 /TAXON_ID=2916 /ORGANISM="Ceratium fusus, Strain PA161109" /LENGTH=370 /DNA_ID=CAMNT_0013758057 /DNA_START=55 /DNA_END=1167 /DNA_ORIENTATION=-
MGCGASASDKYQEPKKAEQPGAKATAEVPATSSTNAVADNTAAVSKQSPVTPLCETCAGKPQKTSENAADSAIEEPVPCSFAPQAFLAQEGMLAVAAEEEPVAEKSEVPETVKDAGYVDGDGMVADDAVQQEAEQTVVSQSPTNQEPSESGVMQVVAPKVPEVRTADTLEQATSMEVEFNVAAEGTSTAATELAEQLARNAKPVSMSHSSARLELDRSGGESLGVAVRQADAVLLITWIGKYGLIPSWSALNPDRAVLPGHRIIQANDASGAADDLLSACRETAPVVLEVDRTHKTVKATVTSDGIANFCRHQIEQLFQRHDQEAIKHLDKRMETYKGREVALYRTYCKKYGEEAKDPELCANSTDDIML